jgi:hypothetical protein
MPPAPGPVHHHHHILARASYRGCPSQLQHPILAGRAGGSGQYRGHDMDVDMEVTSMAITSEFHFFYHGRGEKTNSHRIPFM